MSQECNYCIADTKFKKGVVTIAVSRAVRAERLRIAEEYRVRAIEAQREADEFEEMSEYNTAFNKELRARFYNREANDLALLALYGGDLNRRGE